MPDLTVLSLGAGVQSSALLGLILDSELHADCAIFADTGWEPAAVYTHLEKLRVVCAAAGFPLHVVSQGNIREECVATDRFVPIPLHTVNLKGKPALQRRQCTYQFKLRPIRTEIRRQMGGSNRGKHVDMLIGISTDEALRARDSDKKYLNNIYPLLDRGWSRTDCETYLAEKGWDAPKSSCIGCPLRSNAEWSHLTPEELADAVEVEKAIQAKDTRFGGRTFLHGTHQPLELVRFNEDGPSVREMVECQGLCGT